MSKYSITETCEDFIARTRWRRGLVEEQVGSYKLFIVWKGDRRIDAALTRERAEAILLSHSFFESYPLTTNNIVDFPCRK